MSTDIDFFFFMVELSIEWQQNRLIIFLYHFGWLHRFLWVMFPTFIGLLNKFKRIRNNKKDVGSTFWKKVMDTFLEYSLPFSFKFE